MPSSERCPTCNGASYIARGETRLPCPTCAPANQHGAVLVSPIGKNSDRSDWPALLLGLFAAVLIAVVVAATLTHLLQGFWPH